MSSHDIAAQLVADIIHQKAEAKRRATESVVREVTGRRRRNRAWYFLGALPLLLGLTIWNFARAANPPAVYTASEIESGVRFRMYLAAQAVEAYARTTGRWPTSLAVVGFGDDGFTYTAGGATFEIVDTSSAVPLSYRRGDMIEPFANAYQDLLGRGDGAP